MLDAKEMYDSLISLLISHILGFNIPGEPEKSSQF